MDKNTEWLAQFHHSTHELDDVCSDLADLAYACYQTGNTVMSEKLMLLARSVRAARTDATNAINQMLIDDVQSNFDTMGRVISAILEPL